MGHKTRREILAIINALREHFPNLLSTDDVASTQHDEGDISTLNLDALRRRVVGSEVPGRAGKQLQMRLSLLGLYTDDTTPLTSSGLRPAATWPSQVEVASYLQVPRGRLSQIMAAERQRWVRDRAVTALRHQIVQEVQAAGGVMTIDELGDALLATRATALTEEPTRRQLATALVRAAYEAEQTLAEPRLCMRRVRVPSSSPARLTSLPMRSAWDVWQTNWRRRIPYRHQCGASSVCTSSRNPRALQGVNR